MKVNLKFANVCAYADGTADVSFSAKPGDENKDEYKSTASLKMHVGSKDLLEKLQSGLQALEFTLYTETGK